MSGLLNGENQWEVVQHFTQPNQAKMLNSLVNGASALSIDFVNELDENEIEALFQDIDTDLIHLYLEGNSNSIKEVLNLKLNATIPLDIHKNNKNLSTNFMAFEFENIDFIEEACVCLEVWKKYFEHTEQLDHNLCVSFKVDDDYINNICKIRAIRVLWTLILKSFDLEKKPLKILAKQQDYDESKTLEENFIKASLHLTAASIASANAILLNEPSGDSKSTTFIERITRNIHHLAAQESNLDLVNDPLKGSYVIEEKTNELAKEAWNKFLK